MSTTVQGSADYIRNRILRDASLHEIGVLLPQMETVQIDLKTILHHVGQPILHVYFIEAGTISMITSLADGTQAEVGLVGREGMIGLPLALGSSVALQDALVQVGGTARRMTAAAFVQALATLPGLREKVLRYVHLFHFQVSQTAACNSRHSIDRRLARWLLMTGDRVEDDQFPMTQEFMSRMLAVQRPGVNMAIQRLQRSGLVRHQQNWLRITDRPGLEAVSCECYSIVRDQFVPVDARGKQT